MIIYPSYQEFKDMVHNSLINNFPVTVNDAIMVENFGSCIYYLKVKVVRKASKTIPRN